MPRTMWSWPFSCKMNEVTIYQVCSKCLHSRFVCEVRTDIHTNNTHGTDNATPRSITGVGNYVAQLDSRTELTDKTLLDTVIIVIFIFRKIQKPHRKRPCLLVRIWHLMRVRRHARSIREQLRSTLVLTGNNLQSTCGANGSRGN